MQVGYFRPSIRHAQLKNLYFVGASVHPGTGVPVVLYCARMVGNAVHAFLTGRDRSQSLWNAWPGFCIYFMVVVSAILCYFMLRA